LVIGEKRETGFFQSGNLAQGICNWVFGENTKFGCFWKVPFLRRIENIPGIGWAFKGFHLPVVLVGNYLTGSNWIGWVEPFKI